MRKKTKAARPARGFAASKDSFKNSNHRLKNTQPAWFLVERRALYCSGRGHRGKR